MAASAPAAPVSDWLPFALDPVERQVSRLRLEEPVRLDLPFFHHSIERYRERHPDALTRAVSLDEILAADLPTPAPRGIIHHASRCGSTLVSQGMVQIPTCHAIAEANPINNALFLQEADRVPALRALTAAISASQPATDRLVLKQTSVNVVHARLFAEAFPDTPWVFVFRDPIEIMVSVARSATGWSEAFAQPEYAAGMLDVDAAKVRDASFEEYMGLALDRMFRAALAHDDGSALFLDYRDLRPETLVRVAHHFALEPDQAEADAIAASMQLYSKDRDRKKGFASDGARKREEATPAIQRAAALAADAYAQLRDRAAAAVG